jgi:hypothetical protein
MTWTEPYDMPFLSDGAIGASDPWLVWHDGCIYYAYLEYDITVAKSNDYGTTWTPIQASYAEFLADKEITAIDGDGVVYVVYHDIDFFGDSGSETLRLSRSTDGGNTYHESAVLDPFGWNAYVTVNSSNHVYIAWVVYGESGGNLHLTRSADQGATFEESQVINDDGYCDFTYTDDGNPSRGTIPLIKFDDAGRLYVLWADKYEQSSDSYDVFLHYSDDYGETWSQRYRVNPTISGDQWNPDMDIGPDGKLHIIYYDEQQGGYRLYYRTMEFTGEQRNNLILSDPIAVADTDTSSVFYFLCSRIGFFRFQYRVFSNRGNRWNHRSHSSGHHHSSSTRIIRVLPLLSMIMIGGNLSYLTIIPRAYSTSLSPAFRLN